MKVLFAGPSLSGALRGLRDRHPGLDVRPPAIRGDVARAVADGATAIGLVDGCFGEVPSVWHKEILYALDRGVAVAGGASMGALRAVECEPFGMVGVGSIFRDYRDGVLVDDEAVAVVHAPAELDHLPLSLPWVNFAATVSALLDRGLVSPVEADVLVLAGRDLHFTDRTLDAVVALCGCLGEARRGAIAEAFETHLVDRKRADALAVVDWLLSPAASARPRSDFRFARTTQWLAVAADTPLAGRV